MEPINWHTFFFLLFSLVACAFAVAVLISTNIVRMAFYLTLSLGATSGLFFLAGADFVGAMQLLIYVGGTLVLLIFGVMLTAQGPFISMKTAGGEWVLATIVGGALLALLLQTAFSVNDWHGPAAATPSHFGAREASSDPLTQPFTPATETASVRTASVTRGAKPAGEPSPWSEEAPRTATRLGMGLLGARVDLLEQHDDTLRHGMSGYLLPFEIVSVHLLVVLVGAAYLARAKRRARN